MPHPHLPDLAIQCVQVKKCFLTTQVLSSRAEPHSLMGETGSLPAAHSRRPKQPGSHTSTQVQGYSPSLGCSAPSLFLPVLKTHFLCLLASYSLICPSLGVEEKYKRIFNIKDHVLNKYTHPSENYSLLFFNSCSFLNSQLRWHLLQEAFLVSSCL